MTLKNAQYDILIIDDSVTIIDILSKILEFNGLSYKAVNSFNGAMGELKSKNKPKLIFLDVNMPDLNGYKFCKMLKSDDKYKDILIYYLTGASQSELVNKFFETKADGYITKPFNLNDFHDVFAFLKNQKN